MLCEIELIKYKKMVVHLKENEVVVRARTGNHIQQGNKIPGKLIVTNQRVYFYSLESVMEPVKLEIQPEDIRELIFFRTRLVVPNGLNLVLKDGRSLCFHIRKRDELGVLINKMY